MPNESKQTEIEEVDEQLDDIELAELANKKLKEKDKEIEKLKKDLAKEKLLSNAPEEQQEEKVTLDDCNKIVGDPNSTNYDICKSYCDSVDLLREQGINSPYGEEGDVAYKFLKEVIDECDGDKQLFTHLYQAKLPADDKKISMAFQTRKKI